MILAMAQIGKLRKTLLAFAFSLGPGFFVLALAADGLGVPEPEGFRTENYDDAVPDQLTGAHNIEAPELAALMQRNDIVVFDVLPAQRKPEGFSETELWLPVPHMQLPEAVWLSDVGYGTMSEEIRIYFESNLEKFTQGDKTKKIAFYCRLNCWMGWNAAKRALKLGYKNVYWFSEGTDGWQFEGFPLVKGTPVPMDGAAEK